MKSFLLNKLKNVWSVITRSKFLESHLSLWLTSLTLFELRLDERDKTFIFFDIRLVPKSCFALTFCGLEVSIYWRPVLSGDQPVELDLWWLGNPIWSTCPKMIQEIEEMKLRNKTCKK